MDSEFFALVMDHDPNLVFVKDENSVILYANRAFLEVFPPGKAGRHHRHHHHRGFPA